MEKTTQTTNSQKIFRILLVFSAAFLIGGICAGNWVELIPGLVRIWTNPAQFTMDYFVLGSLGSAFVNTALVGFMCCALLYFTKAECTGLTVAAFWLNAGFATFGMSPINMWPFFLGVFVYSRIKKVSFGSVANMSMFSTAMAPFASELMFRYPTTETIRFSFVGLIGAVILGIVVGCAMPSLCAHVVNFHKGYDLYSAAPAAGFLAFLIYCVLYRSPGIEVPTNTRLGDGEQLFVTIFFAVLFVLFILAAYIMDKECLKGYKALWKCDSYKTDFTAKFGIPVTMVNIGVYGLFILIYYSVVHGMAYVDGQVVFTGAKFTGATMGAIMCMMAFCAQGAQPRNVFPIMIGYAVASFLPFFMTMAGVVPEQSWTLTSQAMLVGMCFASGLAPISGRFGFFAGVAAGAIHALLVTSVPLLHGGFCLYNGGFTAGITAFLLVPVLECFGKAKKAE